jgi:peptidoglycan-associated lipoprotein
MSQRSRLSILVLVVLLAFLAPVAGCKKKEPVTEPEPQAAPAPTPAPTPPPAEPEPEPEFKPIPEEPVETMDEKLARVLGMLQTIHFAFDRSDLDDENRGILRANAEILKANPDLAIQIAGHCDERGTIEYNIALGERRANSVRDYLKSLGVDTSNLSIISYGEEKPKDPGHGEAAWAANRRAEFN